MGPCCAVRRRERSEQRSDLPQCIQRSQRESAREQLLLHVRSRLRLENDHSTCNIRLREEKCKNSLKNKPYGASSGEHSSADRLSIRRFVETLVNSATEIRMRGEPEEISTSWCVPTVCRPLADRGPIRLFVLVAILLSLRHNRYVTGDGLEWTQRIRLKLV